MRKPYEKLLRAGIAALICVAAVQLLRSDFIGQLAQAVSTSDFVATMLFLGTGRSMTMPPEEVVQIPDLPPIHTPTNTQQPLQFTAEDVSLLSFQNHPGVSFNKTALLTKPLDWDLTAQEPTVLIYHTHATESYKNTQGFTESSAYHTLNNSYNMISVGEALCARLEAAGITVIHDKTIHDYPSYTGAYPLSRKTVKEYLAEYPSLCLVLDIHRDAYADAKGNQISNTVTLNGKRTSRLMIVAGTNAGGEQHPNWAENLALAEKLKVVMDKKFPGLARPICIRSSAFNQYLSSGALLIEVGTAGDTQSDAIAAVEMLADCIIAMAKGST